MGQIMLGLIMILLKIRNKMMCVFTINYNHKVDLNNHFTDIHPFFYEQNSVVWNKG